jgi:imidazolonepropionase-like amidohydrolase
VHAGVGLRGAVWPGGDEPVIPYGTVVVAPDGTVAALGPAAEVVVPQGFQVLDGTWVGPGIVDAHVHLAFGGPAEALAGGVVAVRDLGAPPEQAAAWRDPNGAPVVAVAGPLLTAPGGYPSRSWGADGFAAFVATPDGARRMVAALDVDIVKVALEPSGGQPVPDVEVVRAIVEAAHDSSRYVTAHALSEAMVLRALDAGVDELCHTPVERLSERTVERVAASGVPVVSTIETLGRGAARNAAALHAAGVRLLYGTDLGNAGTKPGVDPRELRRLADAGLGPLGALRAATEGSAGAYGFSGITGRIERGARAAVVLLDNDPLVHPEIWRQPRATVVGTTLSQRD